MNLSLQPTVPTASKPTASPGLRHLTVGLAMIAAASGAWAVTSTSLGVGGLIATPKTDDLAALQSLSGQVTQTDVFSSGAGSQTHTYTGPLIWNVLNDAGGIVTTSSAKNDTLNKVVLVTATDGYKVVYSAGELNPNFGAEQALLAWGETTAGTLAPLGSDGFARSTAPLDAKGGRYVSNVTDVQVLATASTAPYTGAGSPSPSFTVTGDVLNAGSVWNLPSLQGLPLPTITQTVGGHTYTGVSLWSFLSASVGLATNGAIKNDLLDMYLVAVGSDGYKAAFSMGELSTDFGNSLASDDAHALVDMIAYQMDGQDLGTNGLARIVAPNDVKQGRWVSNLTALEVYHAAPVPEPQTCALMLAGLALALAQCRRTRN